MKPVVKSISDFQAPDSLSVEIQIIADIVSWPDTLMDAERIISKDMFSDEACRAAYLSLKEMSKEGAVIDITSAHGRIDKNLFANGVVGRLSNATSPRSAIEHYNTLKNLYVRRQCYFAAIEMLVDSTNPSVKANELIEKAGHRAESMRIMMGSGNGTQHVAEVINDLGEDIETLQKDRAEGKTLRVPTGFDTLNHLTFGGFKAGNLIILAARPSVGKTAIMLQMVKAAASAGKVVNLFNLEMTNVELAQRLIISTGLVAPKQIARGEVDWVNFESASSMFASKPIYLNDVARTMDEIVGEIKKNTMAGKCDVVFIDYLGLISLDSRAVVAQAIAECTKTFKALAKECRVPIVLLCQLNRASASERRPPELYDLRDSGSIEQDADIVLMLERAKDEAGNDIGTNIWVRKNRQSKAGEVKIETEPNETYTVFYEKGKMPPPPMESILVADEFNTNTEFPF